ncbi:MAG: type II toxin-antitoxin system RelE/ParE family toxin [Vulcanimicrobiaceae bacterium]
MGRFADNATQDIFRGEPTRAARQRLPSELHRRARAKLAILYAAGSLDDLRSPPGNRLEILKGEFSGRYSIRINDRFRIVFRWRDRIAEDIQILDYH